MANWKKIITSGSNAELSTLAVDTTITATTVTAALTGNATTATTATTVTLVDNESTAEENFITFGAGATGTGNVGLETDGDFTYNPSTGTVSATTFAGTVTTATAATTVTLVDNEATAENNLITFGAGAAATGNVGLETDGDFHYNPSTGTVTATTFAGTVTTATVATTVTLSDNEATAEENVITFGAGAAATGNVGLETDGDFTYNPSTGTVSATTFVGALTGQSSTVATIAGLAPNTATTQAAQGAITSLGTLTSLDVTNNVTVGGDLTVNGTTTTVASTNTYIADKFMIIASGSTSDTDGGIIVQNTAAGAGYALGYDSGVDRWAFDADLGHSDTNLGPDAYVGVIETGTGDGGSQAVPIYGGTTNGVGTIYVDTDLNEIWIYA